MLEREQNERDALEELGEYKCDAGMSVEDVPAIVNIKILKGRLIAHKFNTGWWGRQVRGTSCCCKRINTVEKQ